jgi:hypothetical protein
MNDSGSRDTIAVVLIHVIELTFMNGPFACAFIEPDKSPQLIQLSLRDDLFEATGHFQHAVCERFESDCANESCH